ncbi:MAG: EpsG family protein [Ignavibacteriae bacterium]|nr:EpsG family protein [Ignavibacteriota bacterium]
MLYKQSENKIYATILFLVWPFLSTFFAILNYREKWAKNIIWIFVAFFGYTMVISNEGMDANRYRDQFIEISEAGGETNLVKGIYAEDTGYVDVLKPFLDRLVSLFTNNYKILFLIYGLIFGYFFSRNIWLLLENIKQPIVSSSIILLILFSLINPIWNINGFRFWTAAQIFVYGCLLFFLKRDKIGIILSFIALFVHFSFMLPVLILFIYLFIGNRLTIYFYFFITSLFITEINLEVVRSSIEGILPVIFETKVVNYTNEAYREQKVAGFKNMNWYIIYNAFLLKYVIYLYFIFLYWKNRIKIRRNKAVYSLFSFILFYFGIANIVASIPSGGRFLTVAYSFAIALIYIYVQTYKDDLINFIVKVSLPILLLYIIVSIRLGFDTIGITTVIGNPIVALFMDKDRALIELIK